MDVCFAQCSREDNTVFGFYLEQCGSVLAFEVCPVVNFVDDFATDVFPHKFVERELSIGSFISGELSVLRRERTCVLECCFFVGGILKPVVFFGIESTLFFSNGGMAVMALVAVSVGCPFGSPAFAFWTT